jgi:hypothetical protein
LFKWFAVKKGNAKGERKMKKNGERMKREKVKGGNEGVVSENQAGAKRFD